MPRLAYLLPLLPLFACGCADQKGPAIQILLAHGSDPMSGRCVNSDGSQPPDPHLSTLGAGTVRVSVRTHAANDPAGTFLCDALVDAAPKEPPYFRLRTSGAVTVDLYAEMFRSADPNDPMNAQVGPFRRVATGQLLGVPVTSTKVPDLRLTQAMSFGCESSRLHQARAFHSATLLPNGQVLFIGGVTASGADPTAEALDGSDDLFVTGSVEVWNPSDGTFTQVPPPAGMPPLPPVAFQQAALLPDDGSGHYRVLVVGGITTSMSANPVLAPNQGATVGARFVPFQAGTVQLTIAAAPAMIVTYDPNPASPTAGFAMMSSPALKPAAYQGGAPIPGGLAVAGGAGYDAASGNALVFDAAKDVAYATVPGGTLQGVQGTMSTARIGATLSPIQFTTSNLSALVWGGATPPPMVMPAPPPTAPGDFVTGLGGTPVGTAVTLAGAALTQFHTATVVSPDMSDPATVLVTGGFVLDASGIALQPPAVTDAARVLTVTSTGAVTQAPATLAGYTSDPACKDPMRYRPAGWERATRLPSGDVLVTGGTPTFTGTCDDCENGGMGLLCSLAQASLFQPPSTLAKLPGMQVSRYGHSQTLLADGDVLIAGGLSLASTGPRAVADAEVYNPRPVVPRYSAADPATPDKDDPLAAELKGLGLVRAPGFQALDPRTGGKLARPCPTF